MTTVAANIELDAQATKQQATKQQEQATPESSTVRLEASGLSGSYGRRVVFAAVELTLTAGDCLVVTGPNGSGKSTLLRVLAGLVRPSRGQVTLTVPGFEPIRSCPQSVPQDALFRHVGLACPELELSQELTAAENIGFFARVRGLPFDRGSVLDSLARVGLAERADDLVGSFSSGMRQRLRLLFAVQRSPALLLLDEPGSNLDAPGRTLVEDVVRRQQQTGVLVLATNDPEEFRFGRLFLNLAR